MLQNISWPEYLAFIAVSALVYYVFVLLVYYRHDLAQILKTRRFVSTKAPGFQPISTQPGVSGISQKDYQPKISRADSSQAVQSFTDEVLAYLEEAGNKDVSKEILLRCLSVITGKYPSLAKSTYRDSLDRFLINEVEMNCAVFLSEKEIRGVWDGA